MALRAFVARSFDSKDVERIQPILTFLDSFKMAGFLCEEAERAEVESVSQKVRRMIDERDAFIGFFTRKHPVYDLSSPFANALSLACGRLQPRQWSAPPWVLQECGYALSAGKRLILLREEGVEIPGLQGDLEYIPFAPSNPSSIFSKLSEMINNLLASAAGREIRTEVMEKAVEVEPSGTENQPQEEKKLANTEESEPDLIAILYEMTDSAQKRDLLAVRSAWEKGDALIAEGKGKNVDALWWRCLYLESRYEAGEAQALDILRELHKDNPHRHEPTDVLARLLSDGGEHEESAKLYLRAADLADANRKAVYLLNAAREFYEVRSSTERCQP